PSTGATLRLTQTTSGPQPVAQRSEVISEEPGARDVQARICGGPGWATTQAYPARRLRSDPVGWTLVEGLKLEPGEQPVAHQGCRWWSPHRRCPARILDRALQRR
ncbi:MAG: hypothetical protein WB773_23360, partial [Isosphaeraceae bacterium]